MRVNNVSVISRNDVISTSRKPSFNAVPKPNKVVQQTESLLPQSVIDHFGLDMTTRVGYKGTRPFEPAPETLPERIKRYFDMLEIDWNTRVDKTSKNKTEVPL